MRVPPAPLLRFARLAFTTTIPVLALGCHASEADGRRYPLNGVVLRDANAPGQVTVSHDAIEGLMPAMAMPLSIRGDSPPLAPDDRITATLVVTTDASWLEDVVVTDAVARRPRPPAGQNPQLVGKPVPNFHLRDHENRPLDFDDLRGSVVMVTFIYTRCPLPDYCPRLMRHINDVKQRLDADAAVGPRVRYLAVSFDPAYDTPEILKAYGRRFIAGSTPFANVSMATGAPSEVQAMAGFFGVTYRAEEDQISHSLRTAIVDPGGRVAAVFPSNTWAADDAVSAIRHAAAQRP